MKIKNKKSFYTGIAILIFLLVSYFIKFQVDAGSNYLVYDSLLGILIFHNLFVLVAYIIIGVILVILGLRKIKLV